MDALLAGNIAQSGDVSRISPDYHRSCRGRGIRVMPRGQSHDTVEGSES